MEEEVALNPPPIDFTETQLSTINLETWFSDFETEEIHEKEVVMYCAPTEEIPFIGCNFEERAHTTYVPPKKKKSNRGRKPEEPKKKQRQVQGSGKFMNSQASFYVIQEEYKTRDNPYKIKVFRNGKIQVPGVIKKDASDGWKAVEKVRKLMSDAIGQELEYKRDDKGDIVYTYTLRNLYWRVSDMRFMIDRDVMMEHLLSDSLDKGSFDIPKHKVRFNADKFAGLLFRIKRNQDTKYSSYKIFRGGRNKIKINLDRCSEEAEDEIKEWLLNLLRNNRGSIIYDQFDNSPDSSDSDESNSSDESDESDDE